MFNNIDVIIIGAGPAGIVCARQAAEKGHRVLVVEQKQHIGGHCYDFLNEDGIYIHKYGPHIFHTDNRSVWNYLSDFTNWYNYSHEVKGMIDGVLVPIPFNLNSMEKLFSPVLFKKLETELIKEYGFDTRVPILELRKKEDKDVQFLAEYIYNKVFLNYNLKQWGARPEDLDPEVSGRVPIVISRDDRYFHDRYQGIPSGGYTAMFQKILDHPDIHLILNTHGSEIVTVEDGRLLIDGAVFEGKVIHTGAIDELFDCIHGELPYRSLRRVFRNLDEPYYQKASVINYPNDYDFIRIAEFKYFQQNHSEISKSVICKEYPVQHIKGENNPYYVIKNQATAEKYKKYTFEAEKIKNLHMLGRLAHYQYYDMDQVVGEALELCSRIFK